MIINKKMHNNFYGLKIIVAGGITGGHLFPGIAVAQEFIAKDPENKILFVSTGNEFERAIMLQTGFKLKTISVKGIKRRGILNQFISIFTLPKAFIESLIHLISFNPDLVISVGSYSAGPVSMSARLVGKKLVLLEQNILPGITTKILYHFAKRIFLSFDNNKGGLDLKKIRFSGNPVRKEMFYEEKNKNDLAVKNLTDEIKFCVFVVGGSQGAHAINLAVMDSLAYLKEKDRYFFIHQTGAQDEAMIKSAYEKHNIKSEVRAFFNDMGNQYKKADIVICRSGATTVAELTALGKPAVFIPFPYAADNHQVMNARYVADAKAAEIILEKDLTGKILAEKIESYFSEPGKLDILSKNAKRLGRPDAAKFIVEECYKLLGKEN